MTEAGAVRRLSPAPRPQVARQGDAPWLRVVCVKWGAQYGPEYVSRLFAGVSRALPGSPLTFCCYTDDVRGIESGIETRPLPPDVPGWWNKLYLFAEGESLPSERVVYFDLDVVVVDRLRWLAEYVGTFAACDDWARPGHLNSSVMAWRGGWGRHIWDSWCAAGMPLKATASDQEWIERVTPRWDRLQSLVDGRREVVSYRAHCAVGLPPRDASVVCFHGQPKMHSVRDEWVRMAWSESPLTPSLVSVRCNTEWQARARNAELARRACPHPVETLDRTDEHVSICGGGPSLSGSLRELERRLDAGQQVWACNGAWRYLRDAGVPPTAVVAFDARPETAELFHGARGMDAYLAWHCHPDTWHALQWCRRRGYSPDEMGDIGTTVVLAATCVAFMAGYRFLHLYGVDSSISERGGGYDHHAYDQPLNDGDEYLEANVAGRSFKAAPWMIRQVQDFAGLAPDLVAHGATLTVHGDGLLPWYAKNVWQYTEEVA